VLTPEPSTRLRSQAKLIFGSSLAVGLQIGLSQAFLLRSASAVFTSIIGSIVFGAATLSLWQWIFPQLRRRTHFRFWQAAVAVAAMTATSFVLINATLFVADGRWMFTPYEGGDRTVVVSAEWISFGPFLYFVLPIIPVALLCVIGFNQSWWQIFLLERREHQARELAARAQLEALRAQINPHFLFNSLNSIAQLISTEPERAEECVERLAEIFRYLLQSENRSFVTLEDELDIADAYLDIERARFGERLEVDFIVDEAVRQHVVPTLILQPLIENAVRHGVSQKVGGGKVSIEAQLQDGDLRVVVRDTGVGMKSGIDAALSRGVGLRNVYDRLVQLYGESYAPRIDSTPGAGTTVTVRVPPSSPLGPRRTEILH
jgi:signal transduction histidine kinase